MFISTLNANIEMMNLTIMTAVDQDLCITECTANPEINWRWYAMGVYLMYQPTQSYAERWVADTGRVKYVKPIYESLVESNQNSTAVEWRNNNVDFYQEITLTAIDNVIYGVQPNMANKPIKSIRARY